MKTYTIYKSGSVAIDTVRETTILKAAKKYCQNNNIDAFFKKLGDDYCTITCKNNYSIGSDYIIMLA